MLSLSLEPFCPLLFLFDGVIKTAPTGPAGKSDREVAANSTPQLGSSC